MLCFIKQLLSSMSSIPMVHSLELPTKLDMSISGQTMQQILSQDVQRPFKWAWLTSSMATFLFRVTTSELYNDKILEILFLILWLLPWQTTVRIFDRLTYLSSQFHRMQIRTLFPLSNVHQLNHLLLGMPALHSILRSQTWWDSTPHKLQLEISSSIQMPYLHLIQELVDTEIDLSSCLWCLSVNKTIQKEFLNW